MNDKQPISFIEFSNSSNSNAVTSKKANSTDRSQNALTGPPYYPVHNFDCYPNNAPTNQLMPVQSSMNSSQNCYQYIPFQQRPPSAFCNPMTSQSNQAAPNSINKSKRKQQNQQNSSKGTRVQRGKGSESKKAQKSDGYSRTYNRSEHYFMECVLASFNEGKLMTGEPFNKFYDQFFNETNLKGVKRTGKRNRSVAMTLLEKNSVDFANFIRQKIANESAETVDTSESKPDIPFSKLEDQMLLAAVEKYGTDNWDIIARAFRGRNDQQCLERWSEIAIPQNIPSESMPEDNQSYFFQFQELDPKCETLPDHPEGDSAQLSYNTLPNNGPMNEQSINSAIQQADTPEDETQKNHENYAKFSVLDDEIDIFGFLDNNISDEPNWELINGYL